MRLVSLRASQLEHRGTETPAQNIWRQTHDPKPALPGRDEILEIIQLDFTSR